MSHSMTEEEELTLIEDWHEKTIHAGIKRLSATLREEFKISNLKEKVKQVLKNCRDCAMFKRDTQRLGHVSGHLGTAEPLKHLSMDVYGPVLCINNGVEKKRNILVIIDRCTRTALFKRLKDLTSKEVIRILEDYWIPKHGIPESILADQGRNFISKTLKAYYQRKGIKARWATTNNPTGNGITERVNQTLRLGIAIKEGEEIDTTLAWITKGNDNCVHSTLGTTPRRITNGKSEIANTGKQLRVDINKIQERQMKKQEQNEKNTNNGRQEHTYQPGDEVYKRVRTPSKAGILYDGPYWVDQVVNNGNGVEVTHQGKKEIINIKNVKLRGRSIMS